MTLLRLPAQTKLHWRGESNRRRRRIVRDIAQADIAHLAVVRTGRDGERAERSRRKCLERLLHELGRRGIQTVVLESRGRADDMRDVSMVDALRAQRRVSARVRVAQAVGRNEPLLWVADAVCGALSSALIGADEFRTLLGGRIAVFDISP